MKYALISGASSGIGYNLAAEFPRKGYKVYGGAPEHTLKDMEPLEKLGVVPFALDISDPESVEKAVDFFRVSTGGESLDILYNNAGVGYRGAGYEFSNEDLLDFYKVNLLGHMYMTKYFSKLVVNAKGVIVFTASIGAKLPIPWLSHYCATKSGVDTYAKGIRAEFEPLGVRVYSVITAGVKTNIANNSKNAVSNMADMEKFNTPRVRESIQVLADVADEGMDAGKYAESVVRKIIGGFSGFNIYEGHQSGLAWVASWMPLWVQIWALGKQFKAREAYREFQGI